MSTATVSKNAPAATKPVAATSKPDASPLEKARAARKPVDPNETDAAKLVRLAVPRMKNVLGQINRIKSLGRLKPTDAQAKKVFDTLRDAVKQAELAWTGQKAETESFTL